MTDQNREPTEAASRGTPLLAIDDLAVHFGGVKAVDGVTMHLDEGRIFGILGPNGSGKSTLLGAVTRLTPMTRGTLTFAGQEYHRLAPHRVAHLGIARSFQTVRLLEDRTVRDNVLLGHDLHDRAGRKQSKERVEEVLERIGITAYAKKRPDELSYGIQRRVEIARAIVGRPRLLLLDEPTAGMNRDERDEVSELMLSLKAEGLTQFLVEHDVSMMVDTCDHLFAMNFGKLIASGAPHEVVRDDAVRESYLGRQAAHA